MSLAPVRVRASSDSALVVRSHDEAVRDPTASTLRPVRQTRSGGHARDLAAGRLRVRGIADAAGRRS